MLQHKENGGLLYIIILENNLKRASLNSSNVTVDENMVLRLLYNALSIAQWKIMWKEAVTAYIKELCQYLPGI
jgi:hypothetical protein